MAGFDVQNVTLWFDQRERIRFWVGRISWILFLTTPMLIGTHLFLGVRLLLYIGLAELAILLLLLVVFGRATVWAGSISQRPENTTQTSLEVRPDSITVEGRRIPRSAFRQGWCIEQARCLVLRSAKIGDLIVEQLTPEHRAELLSCLRFAPSQSTVSLPVASLASTSAWNGCVIILLLALLLPFGLILAGGAPAITLEFVRADAGSDGPSLLGRIIILSIYLALTGCTWLGIWMAVRFYLRRMVTVGADGIVVEGLMSRRFYSFASIEKVDEKNGFIELILKQGREIDLPAIDRGEGLLDRIRAAWQDYRSSAEGQPVPIALETLTRDGVDPAAWKERLISLSHDKGGYRSATSAPAQLVELTENVALSPEHRVAAALAATARGDDSLVQRVRAAAAATAETNLRRALEKASRGQVDLRALRRATKAESRGFGKV